MKDYIGKSILANYFRGPEAVGGKIFFDETGLTFKSHALNIQTGETRIEYSSIRSIEKCFTIFVPNGVILNTSDGVRHRFVINHRKNVIEYLNSKLTNI